MATPWTDGAPRPTDVPDARLASLFTSNKIAFRTAIEKFSFWTDSSNASAGQPRLSVGSFGPGSCRAYFDAVSNLSSGDNATRPNAGRLFVASDTSRLYAAVTSADQYAASRDTWHLIGSKNAITWLAASTATIQNNFRTSVQIGSTPVTTSSNTTIPYTANYAAVAPVIQLQVLSSFTTAMAQANIVSSGTTNFVVSAGTLFGTTSTFTVLWRSTGTVLLTAL